MNQKKLTDFQQVCGLILAAGKGSRMKSDLPKVLHKIGSKTLLDRVIENLNAAGLGGVSLVLGGDLQPFDAVLKTNPALAACEQLARQGTGDAVAASAVLFHPKIVPSFARGRVIKAPSHSYSHILTCTGDAPAVNPATLKEFMMGATESGAKLAVLGMEHPQPTGYGRLVLNKSGGLECIVEEKVATADEKKLTLCNTGVIFAEKEFIFACLSELRPNSQSQEYYLTDCVGVARRKGEAVYVHKTDRYREFDGVNDQDQLRQLSEWLQLQGRI